MGRGNTGSPVPLEWVFAYVRGQNKSEFCWLHHTGKKGKDNCHQIAHNTPGNWKSVIFIKHVS